MEPVPDSARPPAIILGSEIEPLGVFPVVAHVSMFAGFGWMLSHVPSFRVVFDDFGAELPTPTRIVMSVNHMFESAGLPLWTLAVGVAAMDFGVCWVLRRKHLLQAANNWMWLVAAGVIPASLIVQQCLMLPFLILVHSMS
ncbi:MAG: hypothetical protein HYY18_02000 [Planctomycetes bacterium]|nr:hypothetical protein [Planctomycetota bacterium]